MIQTSGRGSHASVTCALASRRFVDMTDALALALLHNPALLKFQDHAFCACTCRAVRDVAPTLALLRDEPKAAKNLEGWGLRFPLENAVSRCAPVDVVVAIVVTDQKRGLQELSHYYFCCTRESRKTELSMKQKALIECVWNELKALEALRALNALSVKR
jgi:hypothetical protein